MVLYGIENGRLNLVVQVLNSKVILLESKFFTYVCGQLSQPVELHVGG